MTSIPPSSSNPLLPAGGWRFAPPDPEPPQLDPLSRRLLQIATALSVLLILLVAVGWLHDGGNPLNPIAEAAVRTQQYPGARFAMQGVYTSQSLPQAMTMRGQGVFNGRTGRSRGVVTVQMPSPLGPVEMESVGDDRIVYLRSTLLAAKLPPGDRWMSIEPGLGGSGDTALGSNVDAKGQLAMLQAVSGGVERVGREDVRGVSTTQYRATIDLDRYAGVLRQEGNDQAAEQYEQLAGRSVSPTVVEAWIDGKGLLRRMRALMTFDATPGGPSVSMNLNVDFFDFGIAPDVSFPSSGEVFDATPLVRAQLPTSGS